jgi:hypothetical protein
VKHERGSPCYACTIDISGRGQKRAKMIARWCRYEDMVEYVESLPRGTQVTRRVLVDHFGRSPDHWNIAYLVIRDMWMHRILRAQVVREGGNIFRYTKVL